MPNLRIYQVFISHAWHRSDEYYRLERILDEASYFQWRNLSVPQHDQLDAATDKELIDELKDQIRPASIVLVLGGLYINHSKWIDKEIDIALDMNKPIVGIRPRGNIRTPVRLQEVAKEIVGWNTDSIVNAIRRHAL